MKSPKAICPRRARKLFFAVNLTLFSFCNRKWHCFPIKIKPKVIWIKTEHCWGRHIASCSPSNFRSLSMGSKTSSNHERRPWSTNLGPPPKSHNFAVRRFDSWRKPILAHILEDTNLGPCFSSVLLSILWDHLRILSCHDKAAASPPVLQSSPPVLQSSWSRKGSSSTN